MQNIGYELGENRRSPQWYRANHRTEWVAGSIATRVKASCYGSDEYIDRTRSDGPPAGERKDEKKALKKDLF